MLYMPAVAAIRCNPTLRTFAARLRSSGKHGKQIVAAVMRRLLVLAYAVLKSKQSFDPDIGCGRQNLTDYVRGVRLQLAGWIPRVDAIGLRSQSPFVWIHVLRSRFLPRRSVWLRDNVRAGRFAVRARNRCEMWRAILLAVRMRHRRSPGNAVIHGSQVVTILR